MGLEATIVAGVNTAFTSAGDQVRAISLTGPPPTTFNAFTDVFTATGAVPTVSASAIRYEGKTLVDGVETHTAIYLVRTSQLTGYAVSTAWKITDTVDGDTLPREIVAIHRPHTSIILIHVAATTATTT